MDGQGGATYDNIGAQRLSDHQDLRLGEIFPALDGLTSSPIDDIQIDQRSFNALRRARCSTWSDLAGMTVGELWAIPNAGSLTVKRILEAASAKNRAQTAASGMATWLPPGSAAEMVRPPAEVTRRSVSGLSRAIVEMLVEDRSAVLAERFPGLDVASDEPIEFEKLDVRAANTLHRLECSTWGDVGGLTVGEIWDVPSSGLLTVRRIVEAAAGRHDSKVAAYGSHVALGAPTFLVAAGAQPPIDPIIADPVGFRTDLVHAGQWFAFCHGGQPTIGELLDADLHTAPVDVADAIEHLRSTPLSLPERPSFVECVTSLFDRMEDRGRRILEARRWVTDGATLVELGEELDLTRERVRQIQVRAAAELDSLLSYDEFAPVRWGISQIAKELGTYLPYDQACAVFAAHGLEIESPMGGFILDQLGTYKLDAAKWYIDISRLDRNELNNALAAGFDGEVFATHERLLVVFEEHGIDADVAEVILEQEAWLRRLDSGTWLRWDGNALDKATVVLKLEGAPMTAEAIVDGIGEGLSVRSVRSRLSTDERFVRTGKSTIGLAEWGLEEYSGIADEIFERIDRDGGVCDVEQLVGELVTTFPDVSENSIRMYMSTLAFVVEGGRIRRRTDVDPWPFEDDLSKTAGVFRLADGRVRVLLPVTRDMLRGSGRAIPAPLAAALGVRPGDRRAFVADSDATVLVSWRPWATTGPDIGSLRGVTGPLGVVEGDSVAIDFDIDAGKVSAMALPDATGTAFVRAVVEVGDDSELLAAVARAIGVREGEMRSALRRRGDGAFLELLPTSTDGQLEDVIADLVAELD